MKEIYVSGIFLLVVISVWVFVVKKIIYFIINDTWPEDIKLTARFILFIVLMIVPVADEIIAHFKYKELCEKNSNVSIDIENAKNKVLKLRTERDPNNSKYIRMPMRVIKVASIPIIEESYDYIESQTNKVVVSYKVYQVKGGWLINTLGLSNSNSPLLFDGTCYPAERFTIFRKYNIKRSD